MYDKMIKQLEVLDNEYRLLSNDFEKIDKKRLNFSESYKKLNELKKKVEKVDVDSAFTSANSAIKSEFKKIEDILMSFFNTSNYTETYRDVFTDGGLKEVFHEIDTIIAEVSDLKGDKRRLIDNIEDVESDMKSEEEDLSKKAVVRQVMAKLSTNNL